MNEQYFNTGTKFKAWCERMGRTIPPQHIVDALDTSYDTGMVAVRDYVPTDPSIFRNLSSFLSGRGRGRV